ncbi:hypothetical protein FA13DRAFT_1717068 [Coprinellus micaceus]|uniref:Uncharacterized protein n=1 Tax=Coprinellus micaceus TaxID=71717 RepID=A0A4Y7SHG4_COPMI|nr:hypothetical protein FA13DRAFT_1717068 [Coprinellus micaceus]
MMDWPGKEGKEEGTREEEDGRWGERKAGVGQRGQVVGLGERQPSDAHKHQHPRHTIWVIGVERHALERSRGFGLGLVKAGTEARMSGSWTYSTGNPKSITSTDRWGIPNLGFSLFQKFIFLPTSVKLPAHQLPPRYLRQTRARTPKGRVPNEFVEDVDYVERGEREGMPLINTWVVQLSDRLTATDRHPHLGSHEHGLSKGPEALVWGKGAEETSRMVLQERLLPSSSGDRRRHSAHEVLSPVRA